MFQSNREGGFCVILTKGGLHPAQARGTLAAVMSALEQAEELFNKLTRAEKAQLLQRAVRDIGDAFPGIENRADVCGGEPCIVRTRIPVWLLEQARRFGTSEADLLKAYPTLRAEDLANAWAYVRSHQEEISRQIKENEAD
jgi:uncharacterized protein (DUF433 family)